MPVFTAAGVSLAHGTAVVLDGAILSIEPGERVGLVGRNGCGKTTLLRIIAGKVAPDSGTVSLQRGCRVGYLEQDPKFELTDTLRHAVARAFDEAELCKAQLDEVFAAMAHAEGDELDRLLRRQTSVEEALERAGGWAVCHRIDAILHGVGFIDAQFDIPVRGLSGGQRARLGLARLLLDSPDVLLLDEPTNHLDIEGCRWLEQFLSSEFPGAVVVISHDRWLLDRVVHRIVEIHEGGTREYPGNYRAFVSLRAERHLSQMRVHEKQLDKVRAEEEYIRRYKAGQRAKQARGRATRLERFKRDNIVERPMELEALRLELPCAPQLGDIVASFDGVSKKLGDRQLLTELDLVISPGDRIGVIGPNGSGKSTLVRILLEDLAADAGVVKRSPRLRAGWFRQTSDHLDQSLNVWEYLQRTVPARTNGTKLNEQEARNLAGAFLFSGREQEKLLGDLSGGERARAVIAGMIAGANNLLVLDEPTNHLDIPSTERLESALSLSASEGGYDGAMVLVSHDRALLDSTCERLVILDGLGNARVFEGTYSEWEARSANASATPVKASPTPEPTAAAKPSTVKSSAAKPSTVKPSAAKQNPSKRSALSRFSVAELEARITVCERRIVEIDAQLALPESYKDRGLFRRLVSERETTESDRRAHEEEWLARPQE